MVSFLASLQSFGICCPVIGTLCLGIVRAWGGLESLEWEVARLMSVLTVEILRFMRLLMEAGERLVRPQI